MCIDIFTYMQIYTWISVDDLSTSKNLRNDFAAYESVYERIF